ncbi:MAG: hypothetical protein IJE07_00420 [Clostridia bacterium]|nr:hypothetical protein [Clostridia bacterium]
MIGYDEYREAGNLLSLLYESRLMLPRFNDCGDIFTQALSQGEQVLNAVLPALLGEYAALAIWAHDRRQSGLYALCFDEAREVQRKPYDLLARLEPQAWETDEAPLAPELLLGLTDAEKTRVRRLYHRLLCIQPMRLLLERLSRLEEALALPPGQREAEIAQCICEEGFCDPIPMFMERRSGQRLDLRDNDFTILDRLMDNWDRPLRQEPDFRLPAEIFQYTTCGRKLMTAAIAHKAASGSRQYRAIPGGHIALGVYDGSRKPDAFFKAVTTKPGGREKRLLHVLGYAGTRLVRLTGTAVKCFVNAPQAEDFRAADDGGQNLLPRLSDDVLIRLEAKKTYLREFIREELKGDDQRHRAIGELRRLVEAVFAAGTLPEKVSGEIGAKANSGPNQGARLAGMLLAHHVGEGLRCLPCPGGKPPAPLLALMDALRDDPEACKAFWKDMRQKHAGKVRLDVRYVGEGNDRALWVLCIPGKPCKPQEQWLSAAAAAAKQRALDGLSEPPFSCAELRSIMREGLLRFLYFRNSVGTGNAAFGLSTSPRIRPRDIYFHLLCLWCALQLNDGKITQLTADYENPENSQFETRNGPRTFVELFEGADTQACTEHLTPGRLRGFLQQTVAKELRIGPVSDDAFTIAVSPCSTEG